MPLLVPIAAANDRDQYGGKSANLAFLAGLGLDIPDARVVPAAELVRQLETCKPDELMTQPLRPELVTELRATVAELGGRVSVRSSATLEDARTHSFAGQFLTVLDVGSDSIEAAVRAVWASTFTDNVHAYLRRADLDPAKLRMAVVIQRQIDSDASGVAMGRTSGSGVVIEAVFGQGEALVSGAVSADHWEVDGGRITATRIATKRHKVGLAPGAPTGSVVRTELTGDEATRPSLSDAQLLEVATIYARIAAAREGRPQDCEFAFAGGKLHLLQTRDVTASLPVTAPPLAEFKPPAKGPWELDTGHFQRPCTAMFQALFPAAMIAGFKTASARYGALLSHLDVEFMNGFMYTRPRPVGAPADAAGKAPPPAWVFKLLCKLAPPLRKRIKTAERVWANREWRIQHDEWRATKDKAVAEHLRLQGVALAALDDAALARHFDAVCQHVARMVEQHHTFNIAALLPIGDLVAQVAAWSDGQVQPSDVFALLAGASPVSADLSSDEARELGRALADDATARELLRLDRPEATISERHAEAAVERLRTLTSSVGERVRHFLASREFRLVEGLDPGAPCLRECPGLLWQALRSTALPASTTATTTYAAVTADARERVRAAVPSDKHAELDAMIDEARTSAPLRDERALYSDVWAWGILRTVVLEMGRRVIRRSRDLLVEPADLIHASPAEATSLLLHSKGPSALELETRAAYRRTYTTRDAPATLGPKAGPPPSAALLPPGAGRVMTSVMTVLGHLVVKPTESRIEGGMRGDAASAGVWQGPAHVVNSHDDARDIPAGAVLVVGAGSSTFTMLAPLAAGVVAEGGGLLSHVAIVCREYRIPCVCGVAGVLGEVKTGQQIRVDGTRGIVEVVAQ